MATEHCPECGEPIKGRAKSCACGWRAQPKETAASQASAEHNRCTFQINGRRCRYVATIFEGQLLGLKSGVCGGHFRFTPQSAAATLDESEREIPSNADYSTAAIAAAARRLYEESQVPRQLPLDGETMREREAIQAEG